MRTFLLSLIFGAIAGGCTSYRYEVSRSSEAAESIEKDSDRVIAAPPADLRVRQVDNYCVWVIENPTTQPITLDGGESTLVDPGGQARAVATQLIPPGAFTKIVMPPLRQIAPRGPEFRIGIGMHVQADYPPPEPDHAVKAQYLQSAVGPVEYWQWSGTGSVRLILGLRQGEALSRHEFVITRSKN